ncbi:hypothetical protein SNEBB_008574 [Seison nebaliae]|nr:hypothetical protein SNEBB_008574 [Seison nebaliae]
MGKDITLYGQLVIGPPGSGKSSYCAAVQQLFKDSEEREVVVINLDVANDSELLPYETSIDVRDLVRSEDMDDELGPNASIKYAMNFLGKNHYWLHCHLKKLIDNRKLVNGHKIPLYLIFDCPGQTELYTEQAACNEGIKELFNYISSCYKMTEEEPQHHQMKKSETNLKHLTDKLSLIEDEGEDDVDKIIEIEKKIIPENLYEFDLRLCCVFLVDGSNFLYSYLQPGTYISVLLATLSSMINMDLPFLCFLSKIDLSRDFSKELSKRSEEEIFEYYNNMEDEDIPLPLQYYTDVLDLDYIVDHMKDDYFSKKYKTLSKAIADVISSYSLVSYRLLSINVLSLLRRCICEVDRVFGLHLDSLQMLVFINSNKLKFDEKSDEMRMMGNAEDDLSRHVWLWSKEDLKNTPSFKDGMSTREENLTRSDTVSFIIACGKELSSGREVIMTAAIYFHRFFMFFSFRKYSPIIIAITSMFLAGKVEDYPRKGKDLIRIANSILSSNKFNRIFKKFENAIPNQESLVNLERLLLKTIKFDFHVDNLYKFIDRYSSVLICSDAVLFKTIVQTSYTLGSDSLLTTMHLRWSTEYIAIAVIIMAADMKKLMIDDWKDRNDDHEVWWDQFQPELQCSTIKEICGSIMDYYDDATNSTDYKKNNIVRKLYKNFSIDYIHYYKTQLKELINSGKPSHDAQFEASILTLKKFDYSLIDETSKESEYKQNLDLARILLELIKERNTNIKRPAPPPLPPPPPPLSPLPSMSSSTIVTSSAL